MADISQELATIAIASRGESVRDAIVNALKKMNGDLEPPEDEE